MKININIPEEVKELLYTLNQYGYEAYVVGGCVRDSILGRSPHDWDICTSATPEEMLEIFEKQKTIETGLQHGTITVIMNGKPFEITTFRIDGEYSDNRRPDNVTFTNSLIEDLKRRDFTINAMAYNFDAGLVDPFNGVDDIKYHRINCVGPAEKRFQEDALRILRAIRFAAQLNFTIMPDTNREIHRQYINLQNVSVERINSEFCKIASSDNFCQNLRLYQDVFSLFIPELKNIIGFNQNNPYHAYDVFEHTVHAIENCTSEDLIVRLAVFFHDFGKPYSCQEGPDGYRHFKGHAKASADLTDSIMRRLRFDNETRKDVVELVYYHDATIETGNKYVKRWLNRIGEEQFRRLLKVRIADIKGQKSDYDSKRIEVIDSIEKCLEAILQEEECFTLKNLAVNGKDLIAIGFKPGKQLGNILNQLLQLVIDGECPNEKERLLQESKNCNSR